MQLQSKVHTKKTAGPIFFKYGSKQAWLIRDYYTNPASGGNAWDHSGWCPVQYLENLGLAVEHSDSFILIIQAH